MWRGKVVWSESDIDRLKEHRDDWPITRLSAYLAKSRTAIQNKLKELDGKKVPGKKNKKSYIGKRPDIQGGLFCRSRWESNVFRYLQYQGIEFIYEPKIFVFEGVKRGTMSYLPDAYLPEEDIWLEIKGQLLSKNKTALRRLKKYYPDIFKRLRAIPGSKNTAAAKFFKEIGIPIYCYYNDLNRDYRDTIPNWE